jgi:hypothetical protein
MPEQGGNELGLATGPHRPEPAISSPSAPVSRGKCLWALVFAAFAFFSVGGCAPSKTRDAIEQVREQPLDPDLEGLRKTDPKHVSFEEVGRIATGFSQPRGVAVGPGGVYVVGDKAVAQFDFDGKARGTQSLPAEPHCISVTDQGVAYIGAIDHVMVVEGSHVQNWASRGPEASFTSIAAGKDAVWVADAGNRRIVRYSLDGQVANTATGT